MTDHANESQMSLDSILSGAERPAPAAPAATEVTEVPRETVETKEVPLTQPRNPDGKYAGKEPVEKPIENVVEKPIEKPVEAPKQDMTPKERALLAKAQDETRKRQDLERRLADYEAKKDPPKQFWEDPEGKMKEFEAKMEGAVVNTRLNTAETIARAKYPDFQEKVDIFATVLSQTPGLQQQWLSSPDPAEFAYRTGKNHQEIQQLDGIEGVKEQVRKETEAKVRAELEAEYKKKAEEGKKERDALPGSISNARGTGNTGSPVWGGPKSLDSILRDK